MEMSARIKFTPRLKDKGMSHYLDAIQSNPRFECLLPTDSIMTGWHPTMGQDNEFDPMGYMTLRPMEKFILIKVIGQYSYLYDWSYAYQVLNSEMETNFKEA